MPSGPTVADRLEFETLSKKHKAARKDFDCGESTLNTYLQRQAGQDSRRDLAVTTVAMNTDELRIAGYYTASMLGIGVGTIPSDLSGSLPHERPIPAMLIGRLAVDHRYQGHGVGGRLLAQALHAAYRASQEAGIAFVVVDALNDRATAFYEAFGFIPATPSKRLFLPMATIRAEFTDG
ncbi:MAG TPA: GNAT family N-acetyltransferase [Gammaproteobacteria bacterium]|nr:GNAT family N-acetyltransferase [Gammaproteobacteria bacterium]